MKDYTLSKAKIAYKGVRPLCMQIFKPQAKCNSMQTTQKEVHPEDFFEGLNNAEKKGGAFTPPFLCSQGLQSDLNPKERNEQGYTGLTGYIPPNHGTTAPTGRPPGTSLYG